ncbi:MAG TPA: hydrogenase maturation protease [Aggregatilineaceae bacterium]|nr:hydrogenase maturation protease [Aggregatilineaceae bacterium]
MADTLILGVGNSLMGDDAIGVLVAQQLQLRRDLPPDVDVIDGGTDGIGLIPVMERYRRVFVVDAVPMGLAPGTIRRFTWADVRLVGGEKMLSLHQSDFTEALLLAETLRCLPAEVIIYGVEPQQMAWDAPVSLPVEQARLTLIDNLLQELNNAQKNSAY